MGLGYGCVVGQRLIGHAREGGDHPSVGYLGRRCHLGDQTGEKVQEVILGQNRYVIAHDSMGGLRVRAFSGSKIDWVNPWRMGINLVRAVSQNMIGECQGGWGSAWCQLFEWAESFGRSNLRKGSGRAVDPKLTGHAKEGEYRPSVGYLGGRFYLGGQTSETVAKANITYTMHQIRVKFLSWKRQKDADTSSRNAEVPRKRAEDIALPAGAMQMNGHELFND
ncbi:hypothetical protein BC332_24735 [Capsicum chinense]|nr:hypothetical protein BC332_24735 [Capsicum chinense]